MDVSTRTLTLAEAIARALGDTDALVTHVPGFGGTEVFAAFNALSPTPQPVSFHEEVAFTIAHGAALVGRRAATLIKSHGLLKAANSAIDTLASGTTAGFVILVFHDPHGKHSDSIFDIEAFLSGTQLPYGWLETQDAHAGVLEAFRHSEALGLPVVLLVDSDEVPREVSFQPGERLGAPPAYTRSAARHIVCPLFAKYQFNMLEAKRQGRPLEAVPAPAMPAIPEGLPPAYQPAMARYQPLFEAFKAVRGPIVAGDTGLSSLFALPPYDAIDLTTYMGGSVPLALGAALAGREPAWAVTGDFSFIAAGHLGLIEALQRGLALKLLIVDNGKAQATGGQPVPAGLLEALLAGYAPDVIRLEDAHDPAACRRALEAARDRPGLAIVVARLGGD